MEPIGIFLVCPPGLEPVLRDEAREAGFAGAKAVPGGVEISGGWAEVWRANLVLRGAGRVLARIAAFRAMHPAQLDKRARKLDWGALLPRGLDIGVEASCRKSRIYHKGAAAARVGGAIADATGARLVSGADAALRVMVRIEDDLCTISLDSSGAPLHQRGHKQAVGKAPLRETLAALFLRAMGYDGGEVVADPMCGSGTIPIEAAEIALGLAPGRGRGFAFERLRSFDADHWETLRAAPPARIGEAVHFGADRDGGAVARARENAARAGVEGCTRFALQPVSDFAPPPGGPGLVLVNPPYGGRIGNRKLLFGLYGALGQVLKQRFAGWRAGIVTSDDGLARAAGLDLAPGPLVAHGGLKVRLWQGRPGG